MTHAQWQALIVLLGLAAIAVVANLRELAVGLILAAAGFSWILKHVHARGYRKLAAQLEGSYDEPKPNYAAIVRQAMDWQRSGKEYQLWDGDPKDETTQLFVGHKVPKILGKGSEFVVQIRVDADGFHEVPQLDDRGR